MKNNCHINDNTRWCNASTGVDLRKIHRVVLNMVVGRTEWLMKLMEKVVRKGLPADYLLGRKTFEIWRTTGQKSACLGQ